REPGFLRPSPPRVSAALECGALLPHRHPAALAYEWVEQEGIDAEDSPPWGTASPSQHRRDRLEVLHRRSREPSVEDGPSSPHLRAHGPDRTPAQQQHLGTGPRQPPLEPCALVKIPDSHQRFGLLLALGQLE